MCRDVDLFGEVVVTFDDVEKWLRCVSHFEDANRTQLVSDYIRGYDVVNKIKREKLKGSFYSLNDGFNHDSLRLSDKVKIHFKPIYRFTKMSTYGDLKRLEKLAFLDPAKPRKPRGNFRKDTELQKAA